MGGFIFDYSEAAKGKKIFLVIECVKDTPQSKSRGESAEEQPRLGKKRARSKNMDDFSQGNRGGMGSRKKKKKHKKKFSSKNKGGGGLAWKGTKRTKKG